MRYLFLGLKLAVFIVLLLLAIPKQPAGQPESVAGGVWKPR